MEFCEDELAYRGRGVTCSRRWLPGFCPLLVFRLGFAPESFGFGFSRAAESKDASILYLWSKFFRFIDDIDCIDHGKTLTFYGRV